MLGFGQILKFIGLMPSRRTDWDEVGHSCPPEELLRNSPLGYHNRPDPLATKLGCCFICGGCLSIEQPIEGERCLDPAHWQASGALSTTDYTFMAQIEAQARAEKRKRS